MQIERRLKNGADFAEKTWEKFKVDDCWSPNFNIESYRESYDQLNASSSSFSFDGCLDKYVLLLNLKLNWLT